MKKAIILSILCFVLPALAFADGYNVMWKKVSDSQKNDHPQTTIRLIDDIIKKAREENAYGQLLHAELERMQQVQLVWNDSLRHEMQRFEQKVSDADNGSDLALAAVYNCVMGRVYSSAEWYVNAYSDLTAVEEVVEEDDGATIAEANTRTPAELRKEAKAKADEYFRKALLHPEVLAKTKCTNYEPLVVHGNDDGQYFGHDLLHVIGFEAGNYSLLHNFYEKAGNRPAACIAAFYDLKRQADDKNLESRRSQYLARVDSLCHAYRDIPEAAIFGYERYYFLETATDVSNEEKIECIDYCLRTWPNWIEANNLKNARSLLTLPSFAVTIESTKRSSEQETKVFVTSLTNLESLTMNVVRMEMTGDTGLNPNSQNDYSIMKKWRRETVYTDKRTFIGLPDYHQATSQFLIPRLPVGVYLVEFLTNNNSIAPERALLRVSDLRLVRIPLPEGEERLAVLNANTGQPVKGVEVQVKNGYGRNAKFHTFTTDSEGEVNFQMEGGFNGGTLITTEKDKAQEWEYDWCQLQPAGFGEDTEMRQDIGIYTDRAIYRPGQTVHASAVFFSKNDDSRQANILANEPMKLVLKNPNGKTVEEREATSDEFGTVAADFTLPSGGITGQYRLVVGGGRVEKVKFFRVEEYKRPTFSVDFDDYLDAYQEGDTITVTGRAMSFAGVPVQGAKVEFRAESRVTEYFWRSSYGPLFLQLDTTSVTTDADGRFSKRIPISAPSQNRNAPRWRFACITVRATVSDLAGESHDAELLLPLSEKSAFLSIDLPTEVTKEKRQLTFGFQNAAGKPVAATVSYSLDDAAAQQAETNKPFDFDASLLASGRHSLTAICEEDTLVHNFIVYSFDDKRPPVDTLQWAKLSAAQFASRDDVVRLQIGSTAKNQYYLYSIVSSTDEVLENGSFTLDAENLNREFRYRKEWGSGIAMRFVWVRDGKRFTYNASLQRPEQEPELRMEWQTFRDRLMPGQKEEWTLRATRPDGSPAKAQTMAVLYDKSLDEIWALSWQKPLSFFTRLPMYHGYNRSEASTCSLYGEQRFTPLSTKRLLFATLDVPEFSPYMVYSRSMPMKAMATAKGERKIANLNDVEVEEEAVVVVGSAPMAGGNSEILYSVDSGGDVVKAPKVVVEQPAVRENLEETAFFMPQLLTDADGNVSIRFTLPESVTTWQFRAMAHDAEMNFGFLNAEAVAQKPLMIMPNIPRFLRQGDEATIAARIVSSSDVALSGTAYIDFLNPETEESAAMVQTRFEVDAQQTTSVSFRIPSNLPVGLYIIKVVAQGKGFSDGEQHYVAVLPSAEFITTTRAFTQTEPGTKTIDLTALFSPNATGEKLTVEYTNNPAWLMVQALPALTEPKEKDALSLASALYANSIGRALLTQNPAIEQTMRAWADEQPSAMMSPLAKNEELKTMLLSETPWEAFSDREEKQRALLLDFFSDSLSAARQQTFGEQLQKLQLSGGGFSWWPGMPASAYITVSVAKMMARLNHMVRTSDVSLSLLRKAMGYLDGEMAREVKELKKLEKQGVKRPHPSETAIDYLYTQAIAGQKLSASARQNAQYLLSLLKGRSSELSIYGKAHLAVVFATTPAGPDTKEAETLLESLRQYTVWTEEMGRYFDTKKAAYSWHDYQIPTEVAAIEALQMLAPTNRDYISQMQQWLLQEKRTQMWNTTINSTDAVYAFLNGRTSEALTDVIAETSLRVDGKRVLTSSPTRGLGYVKGQLEGRHKTFTAEKTSKNMSWGAVYAQSFQPLEEVARDGQAMTLRREVLVYDGRDWQHLKGSLRVGDRVKIRITIRTERDLDFVQVSDKRAACLEPVNQLSGYRNGCYLAPHDAETNYFFNKMTKGTHTVETEYFIDRPGTYSTGTATAQCAYAPEYFARVGAQKLTVEDVK